MLAGESDLLFFLYCQCSGGKESLRRVFIEHFNSISHRACLSPFSRSYIDHRPRRATDPETSSTGKRGLRRKNHVDVDTCACHSHSSDDLNYFGWLLSSRVIQCIVMVRVDFKLDGNEKFTSGIIKQVYECLNSAILARIKMLTFQRLFNGFSFSFLNFSLPLLRGFPATTQWLSCASRNRLQ